MPFVSESDDKNSNHDEYEDAIDIVDEENGEINGSNAIPRSRS